MSDTREIEKKSLEAHVELCASRYRFLEEKLETVERDIAQLYQMTSEIRDMMQNISEKRNDQIMAWGLGIMGLMIGIIGYLLAVFVIK
jgi:DNA-binding transcriptional MerR regulator